MRTSVGSRMRLAFAVVLGAMFVASCSSSDPAPSAPVTEPAADSTVVEAAAAPTATPPANEAPEDAPAERDDDERDSPLAVALGIDFDEVEQVSLDYIRDAEERVRECMADQGFEYVPNDPQVSPSQRREWQLRVSLDADRFREQYGYGIASLFELDFQEEGVLAFVDLIIGPAPTESRSESEQAAYEIALNGDTIQGLSAEQARDQAFDQAGGPAEGSCRQIGYDEAGNEFGVIFEGFDSLLRDEFEALEERFENDPRVRDERQAWQRCMAGFGHAYDSRDEIIDELIVESDGIGLRLQSSPEALAIFQAAADAGIATMDQDARFDFLEQAGAFEGLGMVPGLQAELDDLIERELLLASQDFECGNEDVLVDVRFELETDFVAEHADTLALIRSGTT